MAVAGGAFGVATAVQASIPDANGVIHACYNASLSHGSPTGALRVIDTSTAARDAAAAAVEQHVLLLGLIERIRQ